MPSKSSKSPSCSTKGGYIVCAMPKRSPKSKRSKSPKSKKSRSKSPKRSWVKGYSYKRTGADGKTHRVSVRGHYRK